MQQAMALFQMYLGWFEELLAALGGIKFHQPADDARNLDMQWKM